MVDEGVRQMMDFDLNVIKNKKKISISYIQRSLNIGFINSYKTFKELVDKGFVDSHGVVNKEQVCKELGIEYMKIIFLDVDGVLNCKDTIDYCGPYKGIEDKKVALLKEMVESTNSKIVLVSSWKEWWYKEPHLKDKQDFMAAYLDMKLNKQGLTIIDKTNDYESFDRGDGIIKYLRKLKRSGMCVDKYVILDDEMFDYEERKLTKHLVKTDFYEGGLQEEHVKEAIEKLC